MSGNDPLSIHDRQTRSLFEHFIAYQMDKHRLTGKHVKDFPKLILTHHDEEMQTQP